MLIALLKEYVEKFSYIDVWVPDIPVSGMNVDWGLVACWENEPEVGRLGAIALELGTNPATGGGGVTSFVFDTLVGVTPPVCCMEDGVMVGLNSGVIWGIGGIWDDADEPKGWEGAVLKFGKGAGGSITFDVGAKSK